MIEYRQGDILKSGASVLVVPVNTVGIAGKGLAAAAKEAFPKWYIDYRTFCQAHALRPGDVLLHQREVSDNPRILSFASKDHWRNPTRIEWVERGLRDLAKMMQRAQPASVAVPAVGCGCGLLPWVKVRPLIHAAAEQMSAAGIDVLVYEPMGAR